MTEPRHHHYVTRAYLAGFVSPEDGQLHVFDRLTGRTFRGRPASVGHQRDFYRVETSDLVHDEFLVERQVLQRVDDEGLTALRFFADDPSQADLHTRG